MKSTCEAVFFFFGVRLSFFGFSCICFLSKVNFLGNVVFILWERSSSFLGFSCLLSEVVFMGEVTRGHSESSCQNPGTPASPQVRTRGKKVFKKTDFFLFKSIKTRASCSTVTKGNYFLTSSYK